MLLASDGVGDEGVTLVVNELVDLVARGEAVGVGVVLVLADADFEFGGDADVEVLEAAGEDVDVGLLDHAEIIAGSRIEQTTAKANAGVPPLRAARFGRDDGGWGGSG